VEVDVCWRDMQSTLMPQLTQALRVGLLYPSANAQVLDDVVEAEKPETLIVLDGTWSQAKSLYKANSWLSQVPHYQLRPQRPGNYRIRREPTDFCLSTVEAIAQALTILEPEKNFTKLTQAFDRMIDDQLSQGTTRVRVPRMRKAQAKQRSRAPEVLQRAQSLIVVSMELVATSQDKKQCRPLRWWASRVNSGEIFESTMNPGPLEITLPHLQHMGISREELNLGESMESFQERWRAFVRDDDTVVVWNATSAKVCRDFSAHEPVVLKEIYCNVTRGASGHLDEIVAKLGLHAPPIGSGRVGARLGEAVRLVEYLQTCV
jgi:DTW domain-containing protein